MTPDDPRHGSTAGAAAHFKEGTTLCGPCREARRTYNRRCAKNRRRGWHGLVPVTTARRHILALRAADMTWAQIGDGANLAASTVYRIAGLDRPTEQIRANTAAKILAVRPLETPDPALVPLYRVRRRLQALQALGWSLSEIGSRCGWNSRNLLAIVRDNTWRPREAVSAATFAKIDAAYHELSMALPPFNRSTSNVRNRAARNGWLPPLAWDNIDDPAERPRRGHTRTAKTDIDPVVIERMLAGDRVPMTTAERRAVVNTMRERGYSFLRIEARTGISKPERLVDRVAS